MMKVFRVLALCAVVAAAGYLAADDGGGAMGSGNKDGGWMGGPGITSGDNQMGSGVGIVSTSDGGTGTLGSGHVVDGPPGGGKDGGGFFGGGTLSEYVDGNGGRFFVFSFDDGSWVVLGVQ
jgi:hypothetical protein